MRNSTLLLLTFLLLVNTSLQAQNWVNNGNTLSANGTIGTNSNHSLLFETYNTERGRITNTGLWGIGTGTTITPNAKLHINSASTEDPFRIMVNGSTKLLVNKVGGMSIGTIGIAPTNGLLVGSGFVGIGTDAPNAKVHINTIANQDPLRVMYNGSTKMLVHRSGGVAFGAATTPPANGLYVAGDGIISKNLQVSGGVSTSFLDVSGNVKIGNPSYVDYPPSNKLQVANSTVGGTGISTEGNSFGLRASATGMAVYGSGGEYGIYGTGSIGVFGRSQKTGVRGEGDEAGLAGDSDSGRGVSGHTWSGFGGYFYSYRGTGVYAETYEGAYAGHFKGNVYTTGLFQGSDKNIKKNIQEMGNAMSIIDKLKPKQYQFKDDGKYASLMLPKGNHYGLLAQDVEEVLPDLVKESAHEIRDHKSLAAIKPPADGKSALPNIDKEPKETINIKAVNYTELIPIVIKGMQEQQQTIQELQQENNALKERLTKLEAALGTNNYKVGVMGADLQQNYPNPVKGTTTFNYSIPKGASGKILVYDSTGKLVRTLAASDSGQVQMDAYGLSAGTYTYSLIVEGKIVGSKQMVIQK